MLTRARKRQPKDNKDKYFSDFIVNTVTNISIMGDTETNTDNVNTTADVHNNPTSASPPTNTNNSNTHVRPSSGINALPPELLKNLRVS